MWGLLEKYIEKKVTITKFATMLQVSRATVYVELKLGTSKEELHTWGKWDYNADLAQRNSEQKKLEQLGLHRGE